MYGEIREAVMKKGIVACLFLAVLIAGCRKEEEKIPEPPVPVDGRDRFVGNYQVFDTLGVYSHDMTISKFSNGGRDSLLISNYADTFNLSILHESYWATPVLNIGPFFPAYDQSGNRWALFHSGEEFENTLGNDTIVLRYKLSNIAFYVDDGVPFYECECKQIAVKQ